MKSSDKIWIPNPNFIKKFQSSISSPIVYLWMYCWCSCTYIFLFVCVLAHWLLIFMSVYSLIFIWLHTNGETRKYAQFVCECLGVPRPSLACLTSHSTWTKAVHSTCLLTGSHSWAARARGRRGTGQQSVGLNAALRARAPTWDRASRSRSNLPDLLWGSLWGTWVSGLVAEWVVDSTSWPSSVFLARVRPAAVQRVRLSFCSQLSSRSMEPRLSQGKNVKNVLLLWSCSILYNGLHSNSMAEIKPLISSHNQLEYNK